MRVARKGLPARRGTVASKACLVPLVPMGQSARRVNVAKKATLDFLAYPVLQELMASMARLGHKASVVS